MIMKVTPATGDSYEVEVRLGDRLRAERTMIAKGYGNPTQGPSTWMALATYAAAVRESKAVATDFEEWADGLDDLTQVDADEADTESFPGAPSITA